METLKAVGLLCFLLAVVPNVNAQTCVTVYGAQSVFNEACYVFVDNDVLFVEAQADCKDRNGHVASSRSLEENNKLYTMSQEQNIWLGATDKSTEGDFVWDDGTKVVWNKWTPSQPDNMDNEDCMVMTQGGLWNDVDCNEKYKVVCTFIEGISRTYGPDCVYSGWCYVLFNQALTHDKATKLCNQKGGGVNQPVGIQHNNFMDKIRQGQNIWLLSTDEREEGHFKDIFGDEVTWTNWTPAQPDNSGDEDCVAMIVGGYWNDVSCTERIKYICTIPVLFNLVGDCNVAKSLGVNVTSTVPVDTTVNCSCEGTKYTPDGYTFRWFDSDGNAVAGNSSVLTLPYANMVYGKGFQCMATHPVNDSASLWWHTEFQYNMTYDIQQLPCNGSDTFEMEVFIWKHPTVAEPPQPTVRLGVMTDGPTIYTYALDVQQDIGTRYKATFSLESGSGGDKTYNFVANYSHSGGETLIAGSLSVTVSNVFQPGDLLPAMELDVNGRNTTTSTSAIHGIGDTLDVSCQASNDSDLALRCPGAANTSFGQEVSLNLKVNEIFYGDSCVCSGSLRGCSVGEIRYNLPCPPVPRLSMEAIGATGEISATDWVVTGEAVVLVCKLERGVPDKTTMNLTCPTTYNSTDGAEASLSFSVDRRFHDKECVCTANHSSDCYNVTRAFGWNVKYGPNSVSVLGDDSFSVCPSSSAEMEIMCVLDEASPGMNVTLAGIPGAPDTTSMILSDPTGTTTYNFRFRPVQSGNFPVVCRGENSATSLIFKQQSKQIEIYEPPTVAPVLTLEVLGEVKTGDNFVVSPGQTAIAKCSVTGGYPAVSDVTLNCVGVSKTTAGTETTMELEVNINFHLTTCLCAYTHISSCQVKTSGFTFEVKFDAIITRFSVDSEATQEVDIALGRNIFECVAEGNPRPTVTIQQMSAQGEITGGDTTSSGHFVRTLTIARGMGCRDTGKYRCLATNNEGNTQESIITVWVQCNTEFVSATLSHNGMMLWNDIRVALHPNPTSYILYKVVKKQGWNKRSTDSIRHVIDPSEYGVAFEREGETAFGNIKLDWFDSDHADVLNYVLVVLNGIDETGTEIPFNVSREERNF